MFAFVKNLFSKRRPSAAATTHAHPAPAPAGTPASASATPPAEPSSAPPAHAAPRLRQPHSAAAGNKLPQAHTPAPSVASPPPRAIPPEPVFSKETIDLPLKQLWPKLKAEVTQRATSSPKGDALLRIPLNIVQAHLAKGSMNIPYAQLRQFSPPGLFPESAASDTENVSIPLSEILPRLKADQLPRRPGQRKVQVPDDIEAIFGPRAGKNGLLRIAQGKNRAAPNAPPAEAPPVQASAAQQNATPVPAAAPANPAEDSPAAIAPATPAIAAPPVSAAPAPISPITPISPINPEAGPLGRPLPPPPAVPSTPAAPAEPIRAPKLDPSLATLRAQPSEQTVKLALMDVAAFWAEKGRIELENLYRHSVEFPVSALEAALKKGKAEFAWRELRPWLRLVSGNTLPTLPEETKIEFPLSVVAPRFLEIQQRHSPKRRVQLGDDIPDIFVRHTEPAPEPIPPPTAPAEAIAAAPEPDSGPKEFGEIFGQPEKKEWSLGEVSQRTTTLPGVAGAIIGTPDGLLVGGSWPEGVGSEAVAAFAPQIYSRMATYSKELKLGEPGHFTLMVENVPLQIFKARNSYFTVLGRAGETLPERELNAIATRLAASLTEN